MTPLGLTMITPMRDRSALPDLSGATLDPDTQLGMLDGVPLYSHGRGARGGFDAGCAPQPAQHLQA